MGEAENIAFMLERMTIRPIVKTNCAPCKTQSIHWSENDLVAFITENGIVIVDLTKQEQGCPPLMPPMELQRTNMEEMIERIMPKMYGTDPPNFHVLNPPAESPITINNKYTRAERLIPYAEPEKFIFGCWAPRVFGSGSHDAIFSTIQNDYRTCLYVRRCQEKVKWIVLDLTPFLYSIHRKIGISEELYDLLRSKRFFEGTTSRSLWFQDRIGYDQRVVHCCMAWVPRPVTKPGAMTFLVGSKGRVMSVNQALFDSSRPITLTDGPPNPQIKNVLSVLTHRVPDSDCWVSCMEFNPAPYMGEPGLQEGWKAHLLAVGHTDGQITIFLLKEGPVTEYNMFPEVELSARMSLDAFHNVSVIRWAPRIYFTNETSTVIAIGLPTCAEVVEISIGTEFNVRHRQKTGLLKMSVSGIVFLLHRSTLLTFDISGEVHAWELQTNLSESEKVPTVVKMLNLHTKNLVDRMLDSRTHFNMPLKIFPFYGVGVNKRTTFFAILLQDPEVMRIKVDDASHTGYLIPVVETPKDMFNMLKRTLSLPQNPYLMGIWWGAVVRHHNDILERVLLYQSQIDQPRDLNEVVDPIDDFGYRVSAIRLVNLFYCVMIPCLGNSTEEEGSASNLLRNQLETSFKRNWYAVAMLLVAVDLQKFSQAHTNESSDLNIREPERLWRLIHWAEAHTQFLDFVEVSPIERLRKALAILTADVKQFLQKNMNPNLLKLYNQPEKCPVDGTEIRIRNYGSAECVHNHEFERCILSHRCICKNLDEEVLQCPVCLCLILTSPAINCSDAGGSQYCPICLVYLKRT